MNRPKDPVTAALCPFQVAPIARAGQWHEYAILAASQVAQNKAALLCSLTETEGCCVTSDVLALAITAVSIGVVHTALGPDHYLPFAAMARAGGWSLRKTLIITTLCGIGHVASSVVIGLVGLAVGTVLVQLEWLEATRGGLAGWLLIGFGLAYLSWGIVRAIRHKPHTHLHVHADGTIHSHPHVHEGDHMHVHDEHELSESDDRANLAAMTPWLLFIIFVFGPCEPLIPLLIYPAAEANTFAVLVVVLAFSLATLATMTVVVGLMTLGLKAISLSRLHRYSHALAGFAVLACGILVKLGL